MKNSLLFIALFACLLCGGVYSKPGAKFALHQSMFSYAISDLLPYVNEEIVKITIPDFKGEYDSPLGKIDYEISNFKISSFELKEATAVLISDGIELTANDGHIALSADFYWREHSWPHIHSHGSFDASCSEHSADIKLKITQENGLPLLRTESATISIGEFEIDFHGGASWLYNLFRGIIDRFIKDEIQKQFETIMSDLINNSADKFIQSLPVVIQVLNDVEIDYEMVDQPVFSAGESVTIPTKAEFYYVPDPTEYTPEPVDLPNVETTEMLQFFISSFLVDSFSYSYWKTGAMKITETPKTLPSWFPYPLNTAGWKDYIPALYNAYPNRDMKVILQADTWPLISFTPKGAKLNLKGSVNINVLASDTDVEHHVCIISADIGCDVEIEVNSTSFSGNFWGLTTEVSLTQTDIGQFSLDPLQNFITVMETAIVTPLIENLLKKGYPLPLPANLTLIKPTVIYHQDYFTISSDGSYKLPDK
ncbi:bactericidal permeability-increasing bpi protein-related [Anaeramoeba flamelloides]|uniref:Bactericidal permeability-increasing bpi protein-related n=1 Tax=Anaeramoeba flamelloides TaxID=1746091 RepID=A0ABQ8X613_9EUKA|nr:bactericidal permeability-increasing bpi protein-related [Anaeramoeba flamelloides]